MSSYSSMTDNSLVETVSLAGMREEYRIPDMCPSKFNVAYVRHYRIATAALRAIEDAGWKVVKKEDG